MPLHEAALTGNVIRVQELLSQGSNIDLVDDTGRTALCFAAFKGHKEMIQYLISKGADVNVRMKSAYSDGPTPLFAALHTLDIDIITILLKAGANVNELGKVGIWDKQPAGSTRTAKVYDGITALHIVAGEGDIPLVRRFHEFGANVNAKDK